MDAQKNQSRIETLFDVNFSESLQEGWRHFQETSVITSKIGNDTYVYLKDKLPDTLTPLGAFKMVYSPEFFDKLCERLNYHLSVLKSTVSPNSIKYFNPNLTLKESQQFIGYIIYLESQYSKLNCDMSQNLTKLHHTLDGLEIPHPFGHHRFQALLDALGNFSNDDVLWLETYQNTSFAKIFRVGTDTQIAFDELLSPYSYGSKQNSFLPTLNQENIFKPFWISIHTKEHHLSI